MIGIYSNDTIKIVSYTHYADGSSSTAIYSEEIPARIEESNKLRLNEYGKEVYGDNYSLIMIDKEYLPLVNYNNKVIILKKNGKPYLQPDKTFEIKNIFEANGFCEDYIEIYI